ncbi:MAG: DUF2934 domain-containing protein [Nitrospirota bacterium]|nr:DUF2934 domain-containing protein [Nitrospirota bacterium]MDH5585388.1 DUF2934 domain-containing protein [Nitrospirota bacterium]MDH5773754.1 DUF2934 domain-containing protein [Nitrospirota bacterium]
MRESVASAHDQKEPKRQAPVGRQDKMVLNKKENNKSTKKAGRPKMPKAPSMTISDPVWRDNLSTNDTVDPRIAERAYELWQHRGGHHGQDLEDWLAAEREVLSEEECSS